MIAFFRKYPLTPKNLFSILVFTYWVFLTLLLLLPDPRKWLWDWSSSGGGGGYPHLVTFALLGFLVMLGRKERTILFWGIVLFVYVYATEILQELLPFGRCFDWADIGQDITGILIGGGLGILFNKPQASARGEF